MRFEVSSRAGGTTTPTVPTVTLEPDNWDDFGFKCLFDATLRLPGGQKRDLGAVKILEAGQDGGRPDVPDSFTRLGDRFFSVGQDVEYYEALLEVDARLRRDLLRGLRDVADDPALETLARQEQGWGTSLMRFGAAEHALSAGRDLLRGVRREVGVASFEFYSDLGDHPLVLPFRFDDRGDLPGRSVVVIGYNGVGKTRLLAGMAIAASNMGLANSQRNDADRANVLSGPDSTFGSVVAISYSAFDTFALPRARKGSARERAKTDFFGYVYCGLRRRESSDAADAGATSVHELKSVSEIEAEFLEALRIAKHQDDMEPLRAALGFLGLEPSFGRIGVDPVTWVKRSNRAEEEIKRLSTGHKIVVNIVVQLAAHLRKRSLVLIDEPETHLHPPLLAALLKAIQVLLDATDSFAVLATHSPVVLQEIPAECIKVLERFEDHTDVHDPEIETFGENVGSITRYVFSLDNSATDYQGVLERLAANYSLEEIEDLFPLGLSGQARALVLSAKRHSDKQ